MTLKTQPHMPIKQKHQDHHLHKELEMGVIPRIRESIENHSRAGTGW